VYGNASSIHHFGQAAKQKLEHSRRQLATLIHANPTDLVFTSGGTEADNMAVLGVARAEPPDLAGTWSRQRHRTSRRAWRGASQLEKRRRSRYTRTEQVRVVWCRRTTFFALCARIRCWFP
jgi:selenocysteine lyase/cysteine desulfurase